MKDIQVITVLNIFVLVVNLVIGFVAAWVLIETRKLNKEYEERLKKLK